MPDTPLRIVAATQLPSIDASLARLVTHGRGSLAFIFGDSERRFRLLGASINWDRVLLAQAGDKTLGFAALKYDRRGPFAPPLAAFVAEFGALMGRVRFAVFQYSERREWRYPFFLYSLRVVKKARRQGVASALLAAVRQVAGERGAQAVDLEVLRRNHAAQQLYLGQGFVVRQHLRRGWLPIVNLQVEIARAR